MTFKLPDLLKRCAKRPRARLKADESVFHEIWLALAAWIRSQMVKKQGAKIPTFGTWRWVIMDSSTEQTTADTLRPSFTLAESFCKGYGLTNRRCESMKPATKVKDINVYEVAIRYSNKLQKDTVFTGLKDIFQVIGEAAASRGAVKLEVGDIGFLIIKECKASFLFEPEFNPFDEAGEQDTEVIELEGQLQQPQVGPSEAGPSGWMDPVAMEVAPPSAHQPVQAKAAKRTRRPRTASARRSAKPRVPAQSIIELEPPSLDN